MRIGSRLLTACAMTLILTISLAWLPGNLARNDDQRGEIAVFQGNTIVHLSNSNLVDALQSIQLNERLGHAQWRSSVLSLTLLVPMDSGRPQAWFKDVEKMVGLAFIQLDNVNRLLVHIVESDGEEKRLLAAVDVRKEDDWLVNDYKSLAYSDAVHDEAWRQRLRLSFTTRWIERFGQPAGYSRKLTEASSRI